MTDLLERQLRDRLHDVLDSPAPERPWAELAAARARHDDRRRLLAAAAGVVVAVGGVTAVAFANRGQDARAIVAPVAPAPAPDYISPQEARELAIRDALAGAPSGSTDLRIVSGSMEQTLDVGDDVLAAPVDGAVKRGDVVAFDGSKAGNNWPNVRTDTESGQPAAAFIKRVIAVAGDTVECPSISATDPNDCPGVLVNGQPVDESAYTWGTGSDGITVVRVAHPTHHFDSVVVPFGQLFVMGDHRDDSNDSRFNGPILASSVVGVVTQIVWPLAHAGPVP